jgi:hypothetical protein
MTLHDQAANLRKDVGDVPDPENAMSRAQAGPRQLREIDAGVADPKGTMTRAEAQSWAKAWADDRHREQRGDVPEDPEDAETYDDLKQSMLVACVEAESILLMAKLLDDAPNLIELARRHEAHCNRICRDHGIDTEIK